MANLQIYFMIHTVFGSCVSLDLRGGRLGCFKLTEFRVRIKRIIMALSDLMIKNAHLEKGIGLQKRIEDLILSVLLPCCPSCILLHQLVQCRFPGFGWKRVGQLLMLKGIPE